MSRWWRAPGLHFLLIGAALLWLSRQGTPPPVPLPLTETLRDQVVQAWRQETGRLPTPAETTAALAHALDEARLLQAALAAGWDTQDPVVRLRLIGNLRMADPDREADDATLLAEARALGMAEADPVARRRLIDRQRRALQSPSGVPASVLRAETANASQRYGFEQRYFGDDHAAAEAARPVLAAGGTVDGIPLLLGDRQPPLTLEAVSQRWGPVVAAALPTLAVGTWSPPLRSTYGWHLLRVSAVETATGHQPSRIGRAYGWLSAQAAAQTEAGLAPLRQRYPVATP